MEQVRNEPTIYSTAVYCRLSKDDEQAGESVSIETQKMMLEDFCHERGFSIYGIYADDGYSGLDFNRPAFTRLLEDIDNGKVNLVVTKDLSRLGRDYIQTGYYTDVYFSRKRMPSGRAPPIKAIRRHCKPQRSRIRRAARRNMNITGWSIRPRTWVRCGGSPPKAARARC